MVSYLNSDSSWIIWFDPVKPSHCNTFQGKEECATFLRDTRLISWLTISPFPPAAPHEFTKIPFPVKALKLIVNDLHSNGESATMGTITAQAGSVGAESDDGVSDRGFGVIDDWLIDYVIG